jgi:hypothetical protein
MTTSSGADEVVNHPTPDITKMHSYVVIFI